MSKAAWPTAAELQAFLVSAKLLDDALTDADMMLDIPGALDDALDWWEDETGYTPFMASAVASVAYFTPTGMKTLHFGNGLVSCTSVITGYSTTSAGSTLTANEDYYLMPLDAAAQGKPYTFIRFAARQTGVERSIKITGTWGYCANATIPDRAWRAVLLKAALQLMPAIQATTAGGVLKRLTEGDVTQEWDRTAHAQAWEADLKERVRAYRRERMG